MTPAGERGRLIFPEGMNFDCGSCTRCCRGSWTVHLDPHAWRQVHGSPLAERLERENGEAPAYLEEPGNEGTARTRLKGANCVFLGADKLCLIHKEIGVQAKPFGCSQFPFLMRPTPDGVYVGVSFYCSAVQANHGRPLEEHVGDLQRAAQTHHFPTIGATVALDETHQVPWALYREIEADALEAVRQTQVHAGLWQAALRVVLLSSIVQREGIDPATAWARARRATIPRDEIFASLEQVFLIGTIATIESADAAACKTNSAAIFRRQQVTTESFGDVDLAWFDDFRSRFDASWSHAELARFLEHLLFRKFLAYKRNLAANAAAWFLTLPLLEWYRDVSAYVRGALEPDVSDLRRGFDIVERSFTLHAQHMDAFFQELAYGYRRMLDQMPELAPGDPA